MPYRIVRHRPEQPEAYRKAWVKSVRKDKSFRYTSSPMRAKSWKGFSAPNRLIAARNLLYAGTKFATHNINVEWFNDPTEVNPVQLDQLMELSNELAEHGLI